MDAAHLNSYTLLDYHGVYLLVRSRTRIATREHGAPAHGPCAHHYSTSHLGRRDGAKPPTVYRRTTATHTSNQWWRGGSQIAQWSSNQCRGPLMSIYENECAPGLSRLCTVKAETELWPCGVRCLACRIRIPEAAWAPTVPTPLTSATPRHRLHTAHRTPTRHTGTERHDTTKHRNDTAWLYTPKLWAVRVSA